MDKVVLEGLSAPVINHINGLESKVSHLEKRIDQLTELLLAANKARFGPSSEKAEYLLSDEYAQGSIFNEAEAYADENAPDPIVIEKHERKPRRTKEELAKELPVKEIIVDIPEGERLCNICESGLHSVGREYVRRELCIIPARAYVAEYYRINYGCRCCLEETDEANIIKPEVPAPVVKRGLASPSSIAHVMYQKFVNALPLYRQAKDWGTFGVEIHRATLANWIIYTSNHWLVPLWDAFKGLLLQASVVLADETTFQVLKEPGKKPQTKSHMWVYCTGKWSDAPPIVLFEYQPSRAGAHPEAFLKDAENTYLLTDGYKGYNSVANVVLCNCWQHMRRYFTDAMPKNAPKGNPARIGLEYCQKLFELERDFEDITSEERLKNRIEKSKPVVKNFFKWVNSTNPLAGSNFGKAITYAINQKEKLSMFLTDGRIELSTNRIENLIRPVAIGRKNYLFADTVRGAKSSAVAYSIIQTAVLNGLNPYQYLLHLFTELPSVLTKNADADLSRFFPWTEEVQEKCKYAQNAKGQLTLLGQ